MRTAAGEIDLAAVTAAAAGLRSAGARAVVVSLGPDGLLAVTGDGCWQARPPAVVAGNATGAGDAVTAALAHGCCSAGRGPSGSRTRPPSAPPTVAAPVAGEFSHADYAAGLGSVTVSQLPDAVAWLATGTNAEGAR